MNDEIKYYTDEHIGMAVVKGLRENHVDVLTTQEAGMLGASDEQHLHLATAQGRVMITQDDDFLRLNKLWIANRLQHSGIAYAPQGTDIGDFIRGLLDIHTQYSAEQMQNRVEWIKRRTRFT